MRGLTGRVAAVTGGGQGIGAAISRRLAGEGVAVLVTDLSREAAETTARSIRDEGGRAAALAVDVRSREDLDRVPGEAAEQLGAPLSVVVCNAGHQTFKKLEDLGIEEWDAVQAVNARGTFSTLQMAADALRRAPDGGAVVTIASLQARLGSVYYAHYSASKASVLSLTKSFALSLAPDRVRVNCVAPGVVDTELWAKADRELALLRGVPPGQPRTERIAQVPLQRAGTAEDVAAAVAFLASEDASYITGECLHVCGGDLML